MRIYLAVLVGVVVLVPGAAAQDFASEAEKCRAGKQKSCATILKAARSDKNLLKRVTATRFLTDPGALADLARSDPSIDVRRAAIANEHLADPVVLTSLAVDGPEPVIRKAALARVTDPGVLAKAARSDPAMEVRQAAIDNPHLTDQSLLASIVAESIVAKNLPWVHEAAAARAALARITDPAVLLQLAKSAHDSSWLDQIVERLSHPAALVELAETAKFGSQSKRAAVVKLEKLVRASSDPAVLLTVARATGFGDGLDSIRSEAIRKLDEESLARLAMEDRLGAGEALGPIQDPARIAAVAKGAASSGVAATAAGRVTDDPTLQDIARSAVHTSARVAAIGRMAKPSAALWNEVLLRAAAEKNWRGIEALARRSMALDPKTKAALRPLAADAEPFHANLVRALLAGVPSSSWGRVRLESGLSTSDLVPWYSPVPPGTYTVNLSYRGYQYQSLSSVSLKLVVGAKACYLIEANAFANKWRPSVKQEPCSAK